MNKAAQEWDEGLLRAAIAAYDAVESEGPRKEKPAGSDRGGKGAQASDRRSDWSQSAWSSSASYRGGWDTRGSWNANSCTGGKGNQSGKGDKGKRKQPDVPRTPEKRSKHL